MTNRDTVLTQLALTIQANRLPMSVDEFARLVSAGDYTRPMCKVAYDLHYTSILTSVPFISDALGVPCRVVENMKYLHERNMCR